MAKNKKKSMAPESEKRKFIGLDSKGNPPEFPYVLTTSSSIHNRGLFAAKDIPQDAYIIQYLGEKVSKTDASQIGLDQFESSQFTNEGSVYIFDLDEKHDLDGNFDWNIARLANHSCNPNCEAQDIAGEIWFVALCDIREDDELTFDYGYALEHWKEHPCRCGSKNCIGYIVRTGDRKQLKKILKASA
jgi:SET domain-containing protein